MVPPARTSFSEVRGTSVLQVSHRVVLQLLKSLEITVPRDNSEVEERIYSIFSETHTIYLIPLRPSGVVPERQGYERKADPEQKSQRLW